MHNSQTIAQGSNTSCDMGLTCHDSACAKPKERTLM